MGAKGKEGQGFRSWRARAQWGGGREVCEWHWEFRRMQALLLGPVESVDCGGGGAPRDRVQGKPWLGERSPRGWREVSADRRRLRRLSFASPLPRCQRHPPVCHPHFPSPEHYRRILHAFPTFTLSLPAHVIHPNHSSDSVCHWYKTLAGTHTGRGLLELRFSVWVSVPLLVSGPSVPQFVPGMASSPSLIILGVNPMSPLDGSFSESFLFFFFF